MKKVTFYCILFIIPFTIALVIGEVALRMVMGDRLDLPEDERTLLYEYHEELGWFPVPGSEGTYKGNVSFSVEHNSSGFRDEEFEVDQDPMILFLGDSFVWGFDVEKEQRFTELLQNKMPGVNIVNMGVSGYGNDQQYLLLNRILDEFEPEIIFLVYCTDNDRLDNRSNKRYRNYYKPYIKENGDSLVFGGIPVPEGITFKAAEYPLLFRSYITRLAVNSYLNKKHQVIQLPTDPTENILRSMSKMLAKRGTDLLVGLQKEDVALQYALEQDGIKYIQLQTDRVYPLYGKHWTPEGHSEIADKIFTYLKKNSSFMGQ